MRLIPHVPTFPERINRLVKIDASWSENDTGKEYVRTHFLMPRLLRDWLRIFLQAG